MCERLRCSLFYLVCLLSTLHFRSRVLEMEKKKEDVDLQLRTKDGLAITNVTEDGSDDSDDETSDIDEFLDWRSKKAYK